MNLVSCKSMHKILFALQFLLFLMFSAGANAQTISSLSPASGPVGALVTITGTGFGSTQGSSSVSFNGTAATPCGTCWSATSISALVPAGATTGNVVVTVSGTASNGVGFTVTALPSGWSDGDIGTVGVNGSASFANGVFTVKGAGAGITGTSDAFNFLYQPLSGNGTIVARIVSLQGGGSGYVYPAAGVMIRNSLTANDMSAFTDYYQVSLNYNFVYRTTSGVSAGSASGSGSQTLPYWVMVTRNGSTFTSYIGMDGVNWVQVGTSQTISMTQNVYVGLGVTNGSTTGLATATFDSVSVNSTANPGPVISSVSETTGSAGSQVVITGTGFGATQNGSLVTLNNSPMTINSWSSTSITITIPTGATSGALLVSVAPSMNDSNPVEYTVTSQPLPTGWLDQDIGSVKIAGTATYANGVFTVQGAGAGITGTSDAFHFAYQPLSGNGSIIARVVSVQGGGTGYIPPAVGVMIRNSLAANDMSAFMDYYQASLNYNFVYRTTAGASAGSSSASANQYLPYWIMVVRNGSTFSSYIALDGVSWVQVGTSQTINMSQNVYLGLGVTNGNTTGLATAKFDSVSVNSTSNPGPAITSVSGTTGSIGSQVVITGTGFGATQGGSLVTLNDSPMTINSWSSTSITITIPAGATSGPLLVSVAPSMNDSNAIEFTVTSQPLPMLWLDQDLGLAGVTGSASYVNGTYTVQGAGGGISGSSDSFHFVYQPLSGNGTIVARVVTLQGGSGSTYPTAGVMIRETLNTNSTLAYTDYVQSYAGVYFTYRTTTGASYGESNPKGVPLPYWLMVVRSGSTFSSFIALDGVNWVQMGTSQTINMAQTVYIGLAVTNGNNTGLATATFDSVSVSPVDNPAPLITGVSATTGSIGSQVVVSGTGFGATQSGSAVMLNNAPMTINSWSATSITATVPTGATSGALLVSLAPSMNDSNPIQFGVTAQPLPTTWLNQDVGAVGLMGNATYANGVFTVKAAGAGMGSGVTSDAFHFVYQPLSGNGTIVARVVSVQGNGGGNSPTAGVMIRQTQAADDMFGSTYYGAGYGGVYFAYRTSTGGTQGGSNPKGMTLPYWIMVVRSGSTFTSYTAPDGVNWVQVGTSETISMAENVYVGLAVTNGVKTGLATATFDSVSINSDLVVSPVISQASATTGSIGSPVTLYGTGFGTTQGSSLVLLNGLATTINSWSPTSITITIPTGATSGPMEVLLAPTMNSSNAIDFAVTTQPLPPGWLDQDIGTAGLAGSATYSSGTYTVNGAGTGMGTTTDGFHFVYQPLSGNGTIVVQLQSMQGGTYSYAGVMIRETLTPSSTYAYTNYQGNGQIYFSYRTTTGGNAGESNPLARSLPYWLKVVRVGSTFTSFIGPDGVNWTQLGTAQTINMAQNVYVGLAVTDGTISTLATATFNNQTLTLGTMPTISSISPSAGGLGASVTVNGTNFGTSQGTSTMAFNGVAPGSVTSWSSGQIVATVPTNATTGPVTVTVGAIESNTNFTFTVINPVLSSIAPIAGQAGATITLTGSGFGADQGTSQVLFNGVAGEVITWSNTGISVAVPNGATSGPVTVVEGGVTSNGLGFSVEPLSVTSVSPNIGPAGTLVTISGTGFGATQTNGSVMFYGTAASVQSWSDTQITVLVPAGAISGSVDVTVGGVTWYGPQFTMTTTVQLTDSKGNQSSYTSAMIGGLWLSLNGQGSGCSTCSQRGNITYTYDVKGNSLSRTDENGNTTTYTYDSNGNVLTVTAPISPTNFATTTYTYNSFGEVLTATDPMGFVTANTYDANGNLLSVTTPAPGNGAAASVTKFAYNSLGQLTTITDPLGHATTLAYTSAGLIQTITDAQSNVTTYAYDSRGDRTSVTDANNKQTTFTYDSMSRLTQITYPDSTTTQFAYDYRGRRTSVTDQNGKMTTYAYDNADRMITVTDAATNVTTYGYDTESNLTSIQDANLNTTNFTYDAFGRVIQTTFPSGHIETYGYDNVGNLASKTDRKNQLMTYTYDQLNRLTQKSYPDTTTVNYTYDNDSRLTQVTDPTGTYQFTFDNMGRLSGTSTQYAFLTSRTFTTSYGYDTASNRTSFTDPESGATSYAYDTLNRLQTLTPPAAISGGNFGFGYDSLSRRTSLTRPNAVNTSYSYDNLSRLLSVTHALGGTTLDGATYTLDNAGNRTAKSDLYAGVTTNYGYDAIYELLNAVQAGSTTESYTYDLVGNRLSNLTGSGWSYNASNELNSRPSVSYTYDANGNTTSKTDSTGTTTYSWDYDNRLTSASLPGSGGSVSYRYDPFDRRIYKSSSSGTSIYAYDAANVVEETNSTGALVARYSQGQDIDEPLVMLRNSTTSYLDADGLSSITSLTNAGGGITGSYTYDSFGNIVATSGSIVNNFRYTGREFDSETNLYYYRARYFDPTSGRFLSEDPLEFDGGMDFYVYTQNDPVGLVDPSGMQPGPDSNGYWPANLNDPELAPLIVWPYPSSQKFYGVNQECVSLTRKFTGLPCTDCWRPGPKVIGNTIPAGTAVSTFDQNGRYPQEGGVSKNSGIYVKTFPGNSILIIDQWGPHPGSPAHPARARVLNPRPGDPSNDSGSYSVITVPRGTTSKKCKCGNW